MIAIRRHHVERLKIKRKNYYGGRGGFSVAQSPALCSCYACGNPRKHWNQPTIQEQRFMQVVA